MSQLILLCGFPGSGKSTFMKNMRIGHTSVILSPDDFRRELTGQEYFAPAEEHVWATVKLTTRVLLRNDESVIIDATHLTRGLRAQWLRLATSIDVSVVCWWFKTPFEVCCERNKSRARVVPDDVMQRMFETFEAPEIGEGFDDIVEFPYYPELK